MNITKPEEHEKVWGGESWIANNELYCGKLLTLKRGKRCSIHYHINKDETFYILEGRVLMEIGEEGNLEKGIVDEVVMKEGDILRLKPNTKHRFSGLDDKSIIIEFSTHHEEDDSYRDVKSGDVPEEVLIKYGGKE